jgi:hypothetical protein
MDKPKSTPKDFFLWAGAMITLYSGVVAFIGLLFDYINYTFPDTALSYYYDAYQGGVSYEMASLIVLTPVFLMLMRVIRRDIARDPTRNEIWVRRWALFLILFIAGATIVIDLIVLINTFLSGSELTTRFLLKVVVVLLVAGAGFMHFVADLWGFWVKYPLRATAVNWAVGILVLLTIAAGFVIIGTPQHARQVRIDAQRLNDMQSLQSQIVYYYQQKQRLPVTLDELRDPLSYYNVPVDPDTKQMYEYRATAPLTFELCANFTTAGNSTNGMSIPAPVSPYGVRGGSDTNWQHGIGHTCYSRTIDPELYPPVKSALRN